jgi:hypothetical protein
MLQIDTSETKVLELFQHLLTSTPPPGRQTRQRPRAAAKRPAGPAAPQEPIPTPPPSRSTESAPTAARAKRQRRQSR